MSLNFPSNPSVNATYVYNGKIWIYNGTSWSTNNTNQGIAAITSASAPATVLNGTEWFDTSSNSLKVYYNGVWYPAGGISASLTAPSASSPGQMWFDLTLGQMKIYNGSTWIGIITSDTATAIGIAF